MDDTVALSRLHFPVTTLGPGNRIGIWFQGCSIRCEGCISLDTWKPGVRLTRLNDLFSTIDPWLQRADGLTVSGGEPFDQPKALAAVLRRFRAASSADVLVYTGYPFERLEQSLAEMRGLIDALISDPFDKNIAQTLSLRGSDNQRLHLFSALGHERFATLHDRPAAADRSLDVMFDDNGAVWFAGIPARGDFLRLKHLLEADGARALISEHDLIDAKLGDEISR